MLPVRLLLASLDVGAGAGSLTIADWPRRGNPKGGAQSIERSALTLEKKQSRHAWLFMFVLGLANLVGGVWLFTVPDDGSRGPRLPLTSTEGAFLCLTVGAVLVVMGLRARSKR